MSLLKPNYTVLFQGDSITDCDRNRQDPNSLGNGYPLVVASLFPALYPEYALKFINRGISGNRTKDLLARWQEDCLDLKPDIISIMIGINDVWRRYDGNDPTSLDDFTNNYRQLLTITRQNSQAKIIILEPYVLHVPEDRLTWREDLDPKREVVKALAGEFDARFIPMDSIFQAASQSQAPEFWCPDGVHPAPAGHGLIAKAWLETVKAL